MYKASFLKIINDPANAEIAAFLRSASAPLLISEIARWREVSFGAQTHPELSKLLDDVASALPGARSELLYGYNIVSTPQGTLCAVAISMSRLGFRLPDEVHPEALRNGGKRMRDAGEHWIEFDPWKPRVSDEERILMFRHWSEAAYDFANQQVHTSPKQ